MDRKEEIEIMIGSVKQDIVNYREDMAENAREREPLEVEYDDMEFEVDCLWAELRDLETELDELEEEV